MTYDQFMKRLSSLGVAHYELASAASKQKLDSWKAKHRTVELPGELADFYLLHNGFKLGITEQEPDGSVIFLALARLQSVQAFARGRFRKMRFPEGFSPKLSLVLTEDAGGGLFLLYDAQSCTYRCLDHEGPIYTIGPSLEDAFDWLCSIYIEDESYESVKSRYEERYPQSASDSTPIDYVPPDEQVGGRIGLRAIESGEVNLSELGEAELTEFEQSVATRAAAGLHRNHFLLQQREIRQERARRSRNDAPPAVEGGGNGMIGKVALPDLEMQCATSIAFGPDALYVYSAVRESQETEPLVGRLDVYALPSLKLRRSAAVPGLHTASLAIERSGDRYYLASLPAADTTGSTHVASFDVATDEIGACYPLSGGAHVLQLLLTADGSRLAIVESSTGSEPLRLYSLRSGEVVRSLSGLSSPRGIAVNERGDRFATYDEKVVCLFDQEGNVIQKKLCAAIPFRMRLLFTPDDRLLVGAYNPIEGAGQYTEFDAATGKKGKTRKIGQFRLATILPDRRLVLADPVEGVCRMISEDATDLLAEWNCPPEAIPDEFSHDGRYGFSNGDGLAQEAIYVWRFY